MHVIFSRKGFDSATGGCPSPLIGEKPISLPIPTRRPSLVKYKDLAGDYADLVEGLTRGRITRETSCHLDPDLNVSILPRIKGWRGCLGQELAAQSHLFNNGIAKGDLFLFWGLFRPVMRSDGWKFSGAREHRIFGWLQVDEIIHLGADGSHAVQNRPWLKDHPHVRKGWSKRNTLYLASERLVLNKRKLNAPGWGLFPKGLRLTSNNSSPSLWKVPDWLNPARGGVGMTYHPAERWGLDRTVRSAARGQEFIARIEESNRAAFEWLYALFEERG